MPETGHTDAVTYEYIKVRGRAYKTVVLEGFDLARELGCSVTYETYETSWLSAVWREVEISGSKSAVDAVERFFERLP